MTDSEVLAAARIAIVACDHGYWTHARAKTRHSRWGPCRPCRIKAQQVHRLAASGLLEWCNRSRTAARTTQLGQAAMFPPIG